MSTLSPAAQAAARRLHDARPRSNEERWQLARLWWPHASVESIEAVVRLSQMILLPKVAPDDEPTKVNLSKITKIKDGRVRFIPDNNKQEAKPNGSLPPADEVS